MKYFDQEILTMLNKVNYFDIQSVNYKGALLRKPSAVMFDWENTIIKRKHPFTVPYRSISFELFDKNIFSLLELLKKHNIFTAIISNHNKFALFDEVHQINLQKYFNKIIGTTPTSEKKPSIEVMMDCISETEIEFGPSIWMIGDSETDMKFAQSTCSTGILFDPRNQYFSINNEKPKFHVKIQEYRELIDVINKLFPENHIQSQNIP
jgi:histidinol phosphatase-like enzyme